MKRIAIIILTALLSQLAVAQIRNFGVTDSGKIYWQKVFEDSRSEDDIISAALTTGSFSGLIENGGQVSYHMDPRPVDVVSLGYKRMSVPIYVSTYDFSGQVTLQFQEGRYRVTVTDIILIKTEEGSSEPVETWAVSRGQISRNFSGVPSEIYDKYLTGMFSPQTSPLDSDW